MSDLQIPERLGPPAVRDDHGPEQQHAARHSGLQQEALRGRAPGCRVRRQGASHFPGGFRVNPTMKHKF